jgi:hypothetical protein
MAPYFNWVNWSGIDRVLDRNISDQLWRLDVVDLIGVDAK